MNDLLYSGMKIFSLIGLFVLGVLSHSFGNDFRYLRTSEGLYDGEINSIAQDSTGNMWFATWSGLIKYDGYNFEVFRPELGNPSSLPDKKIKLVFVDSQDNLWVASSNSLSVYNKIKNSFHTVSFEGFEKGGINIIKLNEINGHLVIHANDGIYLLPLQKARKQNYLVRKTRVLENNQESWYYFHNSKSFDNQLVLVSNNNNDYSVICFAEIEFLSQDTVLNIVKKVDIEKPVNAIEYVPIENTIYLATFSGIYMYSLEDGRYLDRIYYKDQYIQDLIYTSSHQIFAALDGPELKCLDLHTGKSSHFISNPSEIGSLLPNDIHSLYEDFSGNLWVGHLGQGISIMNLYRKKFHSFKKDPLSTNTLNSNTIMCFEGTDEEIFIGCRTGGLNVITKNDIESNNAKFEKIDLFKNSKSNSAGIWDIARQSDSLFWLATDFGLFQLKRHKSDWSINEFKGIPEINYPTRKIYIDDNQNIWCGTFEKGLIFISNIRNNPTGINYRYASDQRDSTSLTANNVHDIFIDSQDRFWIATVTGLNLLKEKYRNLDLSGKQQPKLEFKQIIAHAKTKDYLNSNEINCIYENYDGKIWLATQGGGINIYDVENEKFSFITISDGLPSNDVQGILSDESGNLWISTLDGLVTYNKFDDQPQFTIYDASDGIEGETFMVNSYYKSPDGHMLFGSDNGFTSFYPEEIGVNTIKPKIAFTNFSFRTKLIHVGDTLSNGYILENTINNTGKITLPFHKSYFKIDVATLHYQQPHKNKFAFKLDGYMNNWGYKNSSNESVEFANLPFGKYTLRVKGVSSDNVISDDVKVLDIEIQPPWYRTWYMTSIFSLLAISLIMSIIYIIINRQRLIYQKKLDKVALENNESKMMFLTNIAHELRTPLSLVIAPIEDLMKNSPVDNLWKNHLQLIHRNSNYLLRLINQIIDFRKLNAGKLILNLTEVDIVRVIKDVVLNFKGYENSRNVNLYVKVPSEPVMVKIDVQKIEEVLYNLISNAFKHTYDNHSIIVSMDFLPVNTEDISDIKQIRISVLNEGEEISEEDRKRIFERFYKVDENVEGAGIGLSFSKSLIELHNGTIEVESIPNRGVAFHVKLPFQNIALDEETIKQSKESEPTFIKTIKSNNIKLEPVEFNEKPTILIVEDNKELREFLYSFFSRNYNCIIASDGDEAMEIINKQNLSLILSDIIMPTLDGYELCRKVKDNLKTCHIPFILLTAKDTDEQVIKGYASGADGYLMKPFDINLLSAQIERLIKNRELIKEKYRTQNFMVEMEKSNISKNEKFVQNVKKILEENISDPEFNVNKLAKQLNISTTQLYRKLKELTGHSPVEFIRILKLQKAYSLLNQKNNTVKEVCYLTGFNNLSYFIKCFREQFGVTPASFRDNGIETKKEAV